MPTHGAGAIGSLDYSKKERVQLAQKYVQTHITKTVLENTV